MPLSVAERKHRLPHGAMKEIAEAHGVDISYVSRAVAGESHPKSQKAKLKLLGVQIAIAAKLGLEVDDVFGVRELVAAA